VVTASCALWAVPPIVALTSCAAGITIRCAFTAAARALALYTCGSVEASCAAVAVIRTAPSVLGVKAKVAEPSAPVVTDAGTPLAPEAVKVTVTAGSAAPAADSTRSSPEARWPGRSGPLSEPTSR
jgi:hypothetical protein